MHRYHRPAALVASAWGGKYQQAIDFLAPAPAQAAPPAIEGGGKFSKTDLQMINAFAAMARN